MLLGYWLIISFEILLFLVMLHIGYIKLHIGYTVSYVRHREDCVYCDHDTDEHKCRYMIKQA
jgi:hypothetical protein